MPFVYFENYAVADLPIYGFYGSYKKKFTEPFVRPIEVNIVVHIYRNKYTSSVKYKPISYISDTFRSKQGREVRFLYF